jgi:diaminohydroxyphosphoribosylaminopyrimidine deaminase/5-amino-6-(5-phosphoribosylamino)uracil reductase
VLLYVAPSLIGDASRGLFNLPELASLGDKQQLQWRDMRQIGADLRLIARLL